MRVRHITIVLVNRVAFIGSIQGHKHKITWDINIDYIFNTSNTIRLVIEVSTRDRVFNLI